MAGKETVTRFDDEQIIEIEIERLSSFKNHPFKVEDDKDMHLLKHRSLQNKPMLILWKMQKFIKQTP